MSEDGINRVALVTGANRGIGLAIFKAFYHSNYTVIGTYRSASGEEILNNIITDESRGVAMRMDVTSKDDVADVFQAIRDKYGPVATLVNNAGITQDNLFMRMKNEEWDEVINTNLNSIFRVTKESIKDMVKSKYGRIINIISISVKSPIDNLGVSNTVRWAMASWAKTLSNEVAEYGITVNNVLPGFTITERLKKLINTNAKTQKIDPVKIEDNYKNIIPSKRFGEPEEVASLVTFLSSKKAGYINGINIPVDGGYLSNL